MRHLTSVRIRKHIRQIMTPGTAARITTVHRSLRGAEARIEHVPLGH